MISPILEYHLLPEFFQVLSQLSIHVILVTWHTMHIIALFIACIPITTLLRKLAKYLSFTLNISEVFCQKGHTPAHPHFHTKLI